MDNDQAPSYISSLWQTTDTTRTGIKLRATGTPVFVGDIGVAHAIVFPDGSVQTSAPATTGDTIDAGTY